MTHRMWLLTISSWRGMSFGAEHWYGKLYVPGAVTGVDITHALTAEQARELNKKDEYNTYKIGDSTERFDTQSAVLAAARRVFRDRARPGDVLVLGRLAVADPQRPIAGPRRAVTALTRIWKAAERSGGWDGDRKAMQRAADQWDQWWKRAEKGK